jgi:hypothetical protein
MKGLILFTLLSVIFVSPYAMAQALFCPCDTAELENGTTGNDIVELLCPGGSLSGDARFELNETFVSIASDGDTIGYQVEIFDEGGVCFIGQGDEVGRKLTLQAAADCRTSLIARCRLNSTPIPTLSQWGLIAIAGILGMAGFIIMRRRKAAA